MQQSRPQKDIDRKIDKKGRGRKLAREKKERERERERVVIITTFLYIKIRLLFKIVDFKTLGYAKYNYGEAI